ncbi:dipeptidase, partial [Streptomyces sp. NPDC059082]
VTNPAFSGVGVSMPGRPSHSPRPGWWGDAAVAPGRGGGPLWARTDGPAYRALGAALREAYGKDMVQAGQGGSIPLCTVLAAHFPEAEIALIGVEEPACLIHAPNESVDPSEIEHMALAEALFLSSYATAR